MIIFSEKCLNKKFAKTKISAAKKLTQVQEEVLNYVESIVLINDISAATDLLAPSTNFKKIILFKIKLKKKLSIAKLKHIYSILEINNSNIFIEYCIDDSILLFHKDANFEEWIDQIDDKVFKITSSNTTTLDGYLDYLLKQIKLIKHRNVENVKLENLELIETKLLLEQKIEDLNKQLQKEHSSEVKVELRKEIMTLINSVRSLK